MLLTFKGRGTKQGEVPIGLEQALTYFSSVPDFVRKIEDVKTIKELSVPGAYLLTHHPIGGLNYFVTIVAAMQSQATPTGLVLRSLDFDLDKIKSEHQVVKGFIDGELVATRVDDRRTAINFYFNMAVEFPVPLAMRLVPQGLITSTADGIMGLKMGIVVSSMYKKVLEDFNLAT